MSLGNRSIDIIKNIISIVYNNLIESIIIYFNFKLAYHVAMASNQKILLCALNQYHDDVFIAGSTGKSNKTIFPWHCIWLCRCLHGHR